jgi:hypothetical protein
MTCPPVAAISAAARELNSDHPVGLRQAAVDLAVVAEGATGGDQNAAAAWWRCEGRCMPIAEGRERRE